MYRRRRWFRALFTVCLLACGVVMMLPYAIMLFTSLKSPEEIYTTSLQILPNQLHPENYPEALKTGNWLVYFRNSLAVTVIGTVSSVVLNSMAGYAFARLSFFFKKGLFLLLMLGLLIPTQVILLPLFIIIKNFPLAGGNNLLGMGGVGLVNSQWALILPYLAGAFGVFMCRQYYLNFPSALDDAATIDGCSRIRIFFQIYFPQSRPLMASLAIIKMTFIWNDYAWPLVALNTDENKTVQLALAAMKSTTVEWEKLTAMAVLVSLPLILVFAFAQKYFVAGLVTSGTKG